MTESIILDRCLAGMDSRFNHKGLQGLKGAPEGFFIFSFVFPLVSFESVVVKSCRYAISYFLSPIRVPMIANIE